MEDNKKVEINQKSISALFIWGGGFGMGIAFYNVFVIAHFLNIFDIKKLVLAFIFSGLIGFIISSVFVYFQKYINFARLATFFLFILTTLVFLVFWGIQIAEDNLYNNFIFLAGCLMIPINTLVQTIFWGIFGRLFSSQEVRKYSSKANFGFILSGILTYLGIWLLIFLSSNFNFNYFILFSAICFAFAFFFLLYISNKFNVLKVSAAHAQEINDKNSLLKLLGNVSKNKQVNGNTSIVNQDDETETSLKGRFYFLYLALFMFLSTIAIIFVDILFYKIGYAQYQIGNVFLEQRFMMFIALLSFGYVLLSFLLKVSFKAGRRSLYQVAVDKYGIQMGLLILPIILAVFLFAIVIFYLVSKNGISDEDFITLLLITIPKLLGDVLREVLQTSVFRLYFTPIPIELRFDIQLKLEGIIRDLSMMFAGFLMLYFINSGYFGSGMYIQVWVSIITIILWVYAIMMLYKQYRKQLENTLEKEQKKRKDVNKTRNQSQAIGIINQLDTIPPQKISVYLNMLKTLNPVIYKEGLLKLIDADNSRVQRIVLLQAIENCVLESIPILHQIMQSKYFPVMENNELVSKTYNFLRGAEFRLERIKYIQQLTLSKLTNERVFGALLTTYSDEQFKIELLSQLLQDSEYRVRYYAIVASAKSINHDLQNMLIDKLQNSKYSTAASSAILATGENLLPALDAAFYTTGQSELVQVRIIQLYGSLNTSKSIQLLLSKLNYSNQNVSAKALETLSQCDYTVPEENKNSIFEAIRVVCQNLVWDMSASINTDKHNLSPILKDAIEVEISRNFDKIFNLLSLLYDGKSIFNIKSNLFGNNDDQATFALELLDMLLEDTLKPVLLPLLNKASYYEKIQSLSNEFDIKSFGKEELLLTLIDRDYNWLNRWTKAVALNLLFENSYQDTTIFVANMVNPDEILREISCKALYHLDKNRLEENLKRIEYNSYYEDIKQTIKDVIRIEEETVNKLPKLKFDIVEILAQVEEFKDVSGETLSHIAKITKLEEYQSGEILQQINSLDELDYFVIYQGIVSIYNDDKSLKQYEKNEWLNQFEFINIEVSSFILRTSTASVVYRIPRYKFDELLSFYPEISISILKNTTIDKTIKDREKQSINSEELINV